MDNKPDILTIAEAEGLVIHRKGRAYWASCPFHADKTPSFKINPEKQTCHCFSCGNSWDVVSLIQQLHSCDFKQALQILGMGGMKRALPNPREKTKRELVKSFRAWERRYRGALADRFREINKKTHGLKTMEEATAAAADLFDELTFIEYHLDLMQNGTDETKYELYRSLNNE